MKMFAAAVLLVLTFGSLAAAKDFYVKPSVPSTACPSGESPCHTLQDYADRHAFNTTNNSKFIFLEGEHHLDTLVEVRGALNLSLVGASSGVMIVGMSASAGFNFETFVGLSVRNLNISKLSVSLASGSDVDLSYMTISGMTVFENIDGTFTIGNSTFLGPDGFLDMTFRSCYSATDLHFSNNTISGTLLDLKIACSNVKIQITDSFFENGTPIGLNISLDELADNEVSVRNTIFTNAEIILENSCMKHCSSNLLTFTHIFTINSTIQFHGNPLTVISIKKSTLSYASMPFEFKYNKADSYGQVSLQTVVVVNSTLDSPIIAADNALLHIVDSNFENNSQSVLWVMNTQLVFDGESVFRNNSGLVGGAIQLLGLSNVRIKQSGFILFEGNHAKYVGGAIFSHVNRTCPFNFDTMTFKVNFINNTANNGGSSVYGVSNDPVCGKDLFRALNVSNSEADPSAVATDPYSLCLCDDGKRLPNCAKRIYTTSAFPGGEFLIRLAAVGIGLDGVVPGDIRAFSINPQNAMSEAYASQASSNAYCDNLKFAVNTTNIYGATFRLTTEKSLLDKFSNGTEGWPALDVTVFLKDCPLGFSLSNTTGTCLCDSAFNGTGVQCFINNQSFLRPAGSWIGVSELLYEFGAIYHRNCPVGYCLPHDVILTNSTSDNQCKSHRTGLLCGQCQDGYSLTLGDGKCVKCSNTYLLLILPLAVAGLLLVAVLFALKLTVTEGTMNGIIFYANVVAMTHNILFAGQTSYLYTFVAWLNLDLGISTCFYNGLDAYAETWLQFAFPVYLWVIVWVVMLVYRVFPRLGQRLGGRHMWEVVATLFLLSYTKLQRTVFNAMSFTKLEVSGYDARYVWLYDANLDFFKGKHLFLGITAILILVIVIIPYTLLLVFFQPLQALSDRRLLGWVNKLKPVFDPYAGAYQDRFRFWTGMLLVVRTLLIILFTINTAGSADVNLFIILLVSLVLLMGHSNTIYTKMPLNYLESFFYLQLGVFAAGMVYAKHNEGNITAVADTSFGLTLIAFLVVVGYHVLHRLGLFKTLNFRMKEYADIEDYSIEQDREI